jgi:signal transduction histidine kinase
LETAQQISTITNLIDNAIKHISGRELVSSSEMIDLLLDIRSHSDLQFPVEDLLSVIVAPLKAEATA